MPVVYVQGSRINYTDAGSGVPLVFVSDLVGSKEWFIYQTKGLSDHYRVICYDLRHARGRNDYTLDKLVDDLARFLLALRIYNAVIVGHSFGGLIALKFAHNYPESTLALVLASATPHFPDLPDEELLSHLEPGEVEIESSWVRFWKGLFSRKREGDDEAESLAYLARHTDELDRNTLNARLKIVHETNLEPIIDFIAVPTLIIAGSLEQPYILQGSQLMENSIDESTLEVVEDADHFFFFTRYDLFNSVLADYLAHTVARP